MAIRARYVRRMGCFAAGILLALMPIMALAQSRSMPGGYGGGYGGGGLGLGVGGAILGGVIGSMARDRAEPVYEADDPPPRRPRRIAEPPTRGRHVTERPRPIVEKPVRRPVVETPPRIAKRIHPAPIQAARTQPRAVKPVPPRLAKAPPPRVPVRVLPAASPIVAAIGGGEAGTVPGEVLIELESGAPANTLARLARSERLLAVESETFTLVPITLHRYRIRDGRNVAAVVRALQADPQVASAQPNHAYALVGEAQPTAMPFASAQYVVAKLHLDEAHRVATGRGVSVAVIDSGVDASHPAFSGAISANWDALTKAEPTPGGADAHGTAVAGIIGARAQLASASPDADLVAIRAFTGSGAEKPGSQGTTFHVLRAIDRAAGASARVVNMSFAGPADAKLSQFLAAGTARGFVYVAAAGNAGPTSAPLHPAADPNVIAVTATDAEDKLFPTANRGPHLCVAAPGVDVFVATPGGTYGFMSGTSMAAPQVAGIVAMMLQAKPDLTLTALREALTKSARDLGPAGPDPEFGAGSADARDALLAVGAALTPTAVSDAKSPAGSVRPETEAASSQASAQESGRGSSQDVVSSGPVPGGTPMLSAAPKDDTFGK